MKIAKKPEKSQKYERFIKQRNAFLKIKEFSDIVYERNNKKIEETDLIIKLKQLLNESINEYDTPPAIDLPPSDKYYYRARIIDDLLDSEDMGIEFSDTKILSGYNKYESKEPPIGISSHGRNNYMGSSYLYLSDDIYTACAEIIPDPISFISLAKFRITERLRIVDFSKEYSYAENESDFSIDYLMWLLMYIFSNRVNNNYEKRYYATQYISDLIRKYGFDGLCYNSSMASGKNYTIFNCNEKNVAFISSDVLMVDETDYNIYDFNTLEKYERNHEHDSNHLALLSAERIRILAKANVRKKALSK